MMVMSNSSGADDREPASRGIAPGQLTSDACLRELIRENPVLGRRERSSPHPEVEVDVVRDPDRLVLDGEATRVERESQKARIPNREQPAGRVLRAAVRR